MKVLHICETAIGGIASYLNIINVLNGDLSNVFLVPEDHRTGIDPALNVRPYKSKGRGLVSLKNHIGAARRAVKKEKPDILFFHSTFSLLSLLAIRLSGNRQPALYCPHGWSVSRYNDGSVKARLVRALEGRLCGLATRVINISQADRTLAQRLGYRGHHVTIENAVPDRADSGRGYRFDAEPDALHLLFVGRLDRQKGLDLLLSAFAKASRSRPDLRLHIIGSAVRADGAKIALPPSVSLIGWVDKSEIDEWYASADALIVPSRWEGFGLVVPEALRNGTPVLSSDRGALPSLVSPGLTGAVFSLDDESLPDLLGSLDKAALAAMRPACRASYQERFGVDRFHAEISACYADVLACCDSG